MYRIIIGVLIFMQFTFTAFAYEEIFNNPLIDTPDHGPLHMLGATGPYSIATAERFCDFYNGIYLRSKDLDIEPQLMTLYNFNSDTFEYREDSTKYISQITCEIREELPTTEDIIENNPDTSEIQETILEKSEVFMTKNELFNFYQLELTITLLIALIVSIGKFIPGNRKNKYVI